MIKTLKLSRLIFIVLMLGIVGFAIIVLVGTDKDENPSVFTLGDIDMPILIIDAGHGGADGGAVSLTGKHESVINLEIAKKFAELAELTGLPYTMTRISENIEYPESAKSIASKKVYDQKRRAELVNKTPNPVLISIHQNFYPHKSPFGPQSFFSKNEGSEELAKLVQNYMNVAICQGNRRVAVPISSSIYLLKSVNCPAILIECGFISNEKEALLLETEEYRTMIAMALTSAYLQFLDDKK